MGRPHRARVLGVVAVAAAVVVAAAAAAPTATRLLRLRGGMDRYGLNDGFQNQRPSPMAIKRIQSELAAMQKEPPDFFRAQPLGNDLLDWHFVLMGADAGPFAGGLFHGRIMLDQDYPMKPPRVVFLTESGRFEVGVPVCLTITSHHAECWQPTWDIRTALTAIRAFMETPAGGALGGIDSAEEDLRHYAMLSRAAPRALPALSDCSSPAKAMRVHREMHEQLAQAAGVPSDPALYAHLQVVRAHGEMHGAHSCDRGDKIGVLRALAAQGRAAVGLLRATEALGGCDIEGVMHAVLGEQGRARAQALVRESEVDTHMELRQQVANLTETNVRLERAVAYKEGQRLEALSNAVAAEEQREEATQEMTELKAHLQRLLHQLALRDQALADMAHLEQPLAPKSPDTPGIGGIDPREPKAAAAAEKLLHELTNGQELSEDKVRERLAEAKTWAMQRLQAAQVAQAAGELDAAEAERRERLRSKLEGVSAGGFGEGLALAKPGAIGDLGDACVPKWLEDRSGIS